MVKTYKIVFYSLLIMSTCVVISSNSWLSMWMGLEINLLVFIPLINNKPELNASEASMKYFIIQALASSILLLSIIIMSLKINNYMIQSSFLMFNSALLLKMGAAPFHFWFPEVISGLSWFNSFILLTWQKIAPMMMLIFHKNNNFFFFIILCCMIFSIIQGFNQTDLRKIMAYSSINHIGWMLTSLMFIQSIWIYYYVTYTIITWNLINFFKNFNMFQFNQIYLSMNYSFLMKILFTINFFSLSGLPPFLGFYPKWLTIKFLMENNFHFMAIIMMLSTLMMIFIYMRLTFPSIIINSSEPNHSNYKNKNLNYIMFFNLMTNIMLIKVSLFTMI
uniref:NADH-ubiquinone oxidoreductase chain 2 n=1 Tax=Scirtidae sp. BMNH 1274304 TaxID=1796542 RepID=A0A126TE11_9COLE|nr:NADH dehydrogenase subunit 2 [Scirtidae sp. BMNH 1274304]